MPRVINLFLILVLFLSGCNSFRPSWVDENSFTVDSNEITEEDFNGPLGGHFDTDGNWIVDDKTIEWTYKIPDISAGFIFDAKRLDVTPSLQIEIIEFDIPFMSYFATWKLDAGVGYNRTFIYLGPRLTSIFEISVGGYFGWNWKDEEFTYGAGFTIIKF